MPIEFQCSTCGRLLRTGDDTAGKRAKCPKCGSVMTIPGPSGDVAPPQPPVSPEPQNAWKAQPEYGVSSTPDSPAEHASATAQAGADWAQGGAGGAASGQQPDAAWASGDASAARGSTNAGSAPGRPNGTSSKVGTPPMIDLADVFTTALNIYKSQLGLCVAAVAIAAVVMIVAWSGVAFVFRSIFGFLPPLLLYGMLQGPLLMVLAAVVLGQCLRLFLNIARGKTGGINELFNIGPDAGRVILTYIAFMLMSYVGTMLCVVPGWILMSIFFPVLFLAFDREASVWDIFNEAMAVTEGNRLTIFIVLLVASLIGSAGSLVFGVGMLLTMPFALMCQAVLYLRLTGGRVAEVA